jgi:hypothetical protein
MDPDNNCLVHSTVCSTDCKQEEHSKFGMTNDNAVHCVGLILGVLLISLAFVMSVGQEEKWNTSVLIMTHPMEE